MRLAAPDRRAPEPEVDRVLARARVDVDAALYHVGFFTPEEQATARAFHSASVDGKAALIAHCENAGDRMALLDPAPDADVDSVLAQWAGLGSDDGFASLYFPWVQAAKPRALARWVLPVPLLPTKTMLRFFLT